MTIANEILMYFRANKKNNLNISLDEPIGYDKEGNDITILDVLKTPKDDYIESIHIKDNIELLKNYMKLLTPREKEIFHLLVKNYSTKDIAKELNISEKTVRNHISNVIQKLGVESRIQAVFELVKLKELQL